MFGSFLITHRLVIVTPFKKDKCNPTSFPNNNQFLYHFCIKTLQRSCPFLQFPILSWNHSTNYVLVLTIPRCLILTRVLVTFTLSNPVNNSKPSVSLFLRSIQQDFFTLPFLKLFLHLASMIHAFLVFFLSHLSPLFCLLYWLHFLLSTSKN